MSKFNPSMFQLDRPQGNQTQHQPIAERKVSTGKKQQPFLKGPVPLPWLMKASQCKGKAFTVAIVIWFRSGLCKSNQITLTSVVLKRFGVDPNAKSRALKCLESAGLITVDRCHGKNPTVTILEIESTQ